jgi:Tol biopolymer transport system component
VAIRWDAEGNSAPVSVADDTNGQRDVFVHWLDTDTTERVSVAADGTEGNRASRTIDGAISADGRYVVFWSDANTFPRATENDGVLTDYRDDVYVKDLVTGSLTLVSTNALDVGADSDAILPTISADGRYVALRGRHER